jgi:hypothetical protein
MPPLQMTSCLCSRHQELSNVVLVPSWQVFQQAQHLPVL